MEFKDISLDENMLQNMENPGIGSNISDNLSDKTYDKGSFESIGKEKISSLKGTISEIEHLIKERGELSKAVIEETEKEKMSIDNFLLENKAIDSDDVRERTGLRGKKVELSELQLNERITCWKDIALLKRELRENQSELNEKLERANMLGKILEGD